MKQLTGKPGVQSATRIVPAAEIDRDMLLDTNSPRDVAAHLEESSGVARFKKPPLMCLKLANRTAPRASTVRRILPTQMVARSL